MKLRRPLAVWSILLGLCLALSSCARGDHPPLYPVHGQVLYQGKPAVGALILFHPVKDSDPPVPRPHGKVGADGSFVLGTYQASDGAPAGDFVVTIDWRQAIPGRGGIGPSLVPPEYGTPQHSPLRATISGGSNDLPPFTLSSEGGR